MIEDEKAKNLVETAHRELFTAVFGSVMDKIGLLHQFLPIRIRSLHDDILVFGWAK